MGKTKAELEAENAELRERLETDFEAAATELAKATSPARSEVLPGGGTFVGAILHVSTPVIPEQNASQNHQNPPATLDQLEVIASAHEGGIITFPEAISFPLSDGGFASAQQVSVVHQPGPGRTVVKVEF